MSPTILAVAPIFALIFIGYGLRRYDFPGPGFWPVSERLTYYVLFPAMLVSGISGREFDSESYGLALTLFVAVAFVSGLLAAFRSRLGVDGPAFTSLFQGAIRPNTYVGLSLAAALLGPRWMTLSAVALLVLIPLVNVLCVLVLSRYGSNGGGVKQVFLELAKNPLIISCLVGMAMNGLDVSLPTVLDDLLSILGKGALPMGLLAVGAGLRFEGLGSHAGCVIVSSVAHLAVLPLAAVGFAYVFGVTGTALDAAIIYTAIPVSVSSFILARQMGGDHRAMALIITVQTVLAAGTIPVLLGLFGQSAIWV